MVERDERGARILRTRDGSIMLRVMDLQQRAILVIDPTDMTDHCGRVRDEHGELVPRVTLRRTADGGKADLEDRGDRVVVAVPKGWTFRLVGPMDLKARRDMGLQPGTEARVVTDDVPVYGLKGEQLELGKGMNP